MLASKSESMSESMLESKSEWKSLKEMEKRRSGVVCWRRSIDFSVPETFSWAKMSMLGMVVMKVELSILGR